MQRKVYFGLMASVVLAIVVYFTGIVMGDAAGTLAAVRRLPTSGWLAVLTLSLVNYFLRYARWDYGIRQRSGVRLPHLRHLTSYLGGFAFTTTPGKAGEAFRCVWLKQDGVGHDVSLAVLVYERVLDLAAMLIIASLALVAFPRYRWLLLVPSALILIFLVLLHSGLLISLCQKISQRNTGKLGKLIHHIGHMLDQTRGLMAWQPLLIGLTLGVLAWGSEGFAFYIIAVKLGIPLSSPLAMGIYAIGMLAGAFAAIPGGIGGAEAAMTLCLKLLGAPLTSAVAATLLCRITTLWFAIALGLLCCARIAMRAPMHATLNQTGSKQYE